MEGRLEELIGGLRIVFYLLADAKIVLHKALNSFAPDKAKMERVQELLDAAEETIKKCDQKSEHYTVEQKDTFLYYQEGFKTIKMKLTTTVQDFEACNVALAKIPPQDSEAIKVAMEKIRSPDFEVLKAIQETNPAQWKGCLSPESGYGSTFCSMEGVPIS